MISKGKIFYILVHAGGVGFNSRDPGSILVGDVSWDILKNRGIYRFHFQYIVYYNEIYIYNEMYISLILIMNKHVYCITIEF